MTLSVLLVATLSEQVRGSEPAAAESAAPAPSRCPESRPDEAAARITARLCGGRVQIEALKTEYTTAFAQPDGSVAVEQSLGQVRFRDQEGAWRNVDMTLERRPDGRVAPKAHPAGLELAGASSNGDNDLAAMKIAGERVALGWRGALPEPVISGTVARYPSVRPGVDLEVEVTRTSFMTRLIVANRGAAQQLGDIAMPWRPGQLSAVSDGEGGLELRKPSGDAVASVSAPQMWDSSSVNGSGEPARRATMPLRVVARGQGRDLVITPDARMLADPDVVWPLVIDPSPTPFGPNLDLYVQSGTTSDQSGSTELRLGTFDGGTTKARTLIRFLSLGYLWGKYVQSASLKLWNFHSWNCSSNDWQVWSVGYFYSAARWTNQPSWNTLRVTTGQNHGYSSSCPDDWATVDVRPDFQAVADSGGVATAVYLGLKAVSETNNNQWKKFSSEEGTHSPSVTLVYTSYPTVGTRSTVPSTSCVIGSGRPYINTTTPTLRAQVSDAEGASVKAEFSWWVTGGSQIGSAVTSTAPSGSTLQHVVPSGAFSNGNNYSWRVRGNDGIVNSAWSSWCEFTVDTVAPSIVPGVSSTTYPEGGWGGGAGTPGTFTFSASGVSDVASYVYGLDTNPPTTSVAATTLGGTAAVDITPPTNLPHTLYVQSVDRAGNKSPVRSYQFNVGSSAGTVLLPRTGDMSASKFALQGQGQSGATGVTFQWRRGDADSWTTIPASDVTYAAGGGPVTWPQPTTGGGAFAKLNWDVAATLNNAEAGSEPLSGPLQVRASFTGAGGSSDQVNVTFDLDRAWASSVGMGPGSVNLLTGNLSVGLTDVAAFDLSLARSFNTRQAGAADAMFGPGWVSSVTAKADPGYTDLSVTGSLAQIGLPDGAVLGFAKESGTATTAIYAPQVGAEGFALTWTSSPDRFTLTDANGNVVLFDRPSGGATGLYVPVSVTPVGSSETTTVSWELVPGSTTAARPTRLLAPVPAGVSCSPTLAAGCRALTFTYATTTTATGTGASDWGDYNGRVVKAEFTAWDPDAGPAAMRTVEMARYLYDSNGRLRASWDPRLNWLDTSELPPVTRQVRTVYAYDANGVMTSLTPPAQEAWNFAYTTVPGDSGLGRLATVTRSALSAGSAVSTVVYRVPVSGSGAPYDLSAGQTARWGQAEAPTDATALYPPTQVPDGNQSTGTMPSSYERATVAYMDANGRTVNSADPAGAVDTTWYDLYGNTIRTLTPGNRKRALDFSGSDTAAVEAQLADTWSTIDTYSSDGERLLDSLGPAHDMALATGDVVNGRAHTVFTYDQGAPSGGPYNLVTTTATSVRYTGAGGTPVEADTRTTTTEYDWSLRSPTVETVDPGGLALTTRTTYYGDGKVDRITAPAGGTSTNTPSTRRNYYYRAGTGSGASDCDSHPEWAGLACRLDHGGQAATGPELPVKLTTYGMYGQPRTMVEKTSAGTLRTRTLTFDAAGRPVTAAITTASGLGTAVPMTKVVYEPASGQVVRTQSLDAGNNVTAEVVRAHDTLGRLTSYTDADGNTSTATYDLSSQIATFYDGKATRTYTYDQGTERRGLPTQVADTGVGTMTATYDTDGNVTQQAWPDNIVVNTTVDPSGAPVALSYVQTGCGQPDCTLYTETVTANAHGEWSTRLSTLSAQTYGYDAAARLTTVRDTVSGSCTTRAYAFVGTAGLASNRTGLTTYAPNSDGTCQSTTAASTRSYAYDTADRIGTTGTAYDDLSRTLTTTATDMSLPANGNATMAYHTNDIVRSISQNGRTTVYSLDVLANRIRSWTDNLTGSVVTKTNHYANDGDMPTWTNEGDGSWTRVVHGLGGPVAIQVGPTAGNVGWQLSNLRGDFVATVVGGTLGLGYTSEQDESGQPRESPDVGSRRYGWLGSAQRAADTPGGSILMGVRMYNPATGRFLSNDPITGGSANAHDYCNADPLNCTDVSGLKPGSSVSCRAIDAGKYKILWTTIRWVKIRCIMSHSFIRKIIDASNAYAIWLFIGAAALGALAGACATIALLACGPAAPFLGAAAGYLTFGATLVAAITWFAEKAYSWLCGRQAGIWATFRLLKNRYATWPQIMGVGCV
jgi:RHS repeat-associated protein